MSNRIIAASCRDGVDLLFLNEVATIPFLPRPNTIYQKEKRQFWERNDLDRSWRIGCSGSRMVTDTLFCPFKNCIAPNHCYTLTRVQIPNGKINTMILLNRPMSGKNLL